MSLCVFYAGGWLISKMEVIVNSFNGLHMGLGNLSLLSSAQTRSISPENRSGEKGKGGMATEGTGAECARDLGVGWKISPSLRMPAHETLVLADIAGPGAIQSIWMTLTGRWRYSILRVYWDNEKTPSIEVPAGDFFCMGWGRYAQINSQPVAVNPGSAFNCYWEMPFRKRALVTIENIDDEQQTVYYQINYTLTDVPDNAAYLHAQFRRSNPLAYGTDHTLLDGVRGRGHYVGTYIAWGVNNTGWWGEGEIKFFMDGDSMWPTICGTGTEDYFGGSYDFEYPRGVALLRVLGALHRLAAGHSAQPAVRLADALRHVPLAHHGPGAIPDRPACDHSGAGLALRPSLSPTTGRHRLDRLLVPGRAARRLPRAARPRCT